MHRTLVPLLVLFVLSAAAPASVPAVTSVPVQSAVSIDEHWQNQVPNPVPAEPRWDGPRFKTDEIDEFEWPNHGQNRQQTWHNPLEPQDTLALAWTSNPGGWPWAPWFGYPVSADGKVLYVDCYMGTLYCRDIDDGSLIWSQVVQSHSSSSSRYYPGTPVIFEGTGGELWVAVPNYNTPTESNRQRMSCYKLADGSPVWSTHVPLGGAGIAGTNMNFNRPVYHDGFIYHITLEFTSPYGGALYKVNALTGDTTRLSTLGSTCGGALTIDPDGTYGYWARWNPASPGNCRVMRINLTTLAVDSSPQVTSYLRGSLAFNSVSRRMFIEGSASTSGTGYIFCFNPDNLTAGPVWTSQTDGGHDIQYLAIDEENAYVCTQGTPGRIYAVKQSDGSAAWGGNTWRPIPGTSGAIYDGGVCVTGEVGRNRYLYLTPGFYGGGFLWVVNAVDGSTVQFKNVSTGERMFTGALRPYGYFVSKSGYGIIYCWRSQNDSRAKYSVAMSSILVPAGQADSGQALVPRVVVQNKSETAVDSFDVYMSIKRGASELFGDTVSVLGMAPRGFDTVDFASWTPHGRDTLQVTAWVWWQPDSVRGDDTLSTSVALRVRDVAVTDIFAPVDTLDSAATAYPQCQVANYGNTSETFDVEFRIGLYQSAASVSGLNPGEARTITAPDEYVARSGVWVHAVTAQLVGDLLPANNVMLDTFWVRGSPEHDVAAEMILSPTGMLDTGRVVTPMARVANYGGVPELFWAWFSIHDSVTDQQMYRDSLQVSLGGGSNTVVAFRDTLFRLQGPYLARCSVDVYGDQNNINNVAEDSFEVSSMQHNVRMHQILVPSGSVDSGATVTPTVQVWNTGRNAETFPVYLVIQGGYLSSATVTALPPDSVRTVQLQPWQATSARDSLFLTAWTYLTGDERPGDDTLTRRFYVHVRDVAVTQVLAPVDTLAEGLVVYPQAELRNLSTVPENFDLLFNIGLYSDTANITLAPGVTDTITMADSITTQPGVWLDNVFADVSGDMNPGNNVMLDTFWVLGTITHDVGVAAILEPIGTTDTMTEVTPRARVGNYGAEEETWWTYFTVRRQPSGQVVYSQSLQWTLGPGEEDVLQFPVTKFTVGGAYVSRCSTFLATDQNWTNNVATEAFDVSEPSSWEPGWKEMKSMPALPSSRPVKEGGWLTIDGDKMIYAAKGYKTGDFYRYDAMRNTWTQLETIPAAEAGRIKPPKKGSRGVSDGERYIYMTKGNNTLGFWRYDAERDSWSRLPDVPLGLDGKKVKGGTDAVYAVKNDTGYVYLMKGYRTEFYRFNTARQTWDTLDPVPVGVKSKYVEGSWLAYVPASPTPPYPFAAIYAHQASYYNKAKLSHYMFLYNVDGDSWMRNGLSGMPVMGLYSGRIRKKKSKDGGSAASYGVELYALKGGNTQQFFKYIPLGDTWQEIDTMPQYGSTGKKKRVKNGGDIVSYGRDAFFALKGNKTYEFWRYRIPSYFGGTPARGGVMAGSVVGSERRMAVTPNPIASGFATLRYSLPKAGPVTVSVFDVAGRSVHRQVLVARLSGAASIDLRKLANGVYLVRLDAEGYSQSQKLVVQK